VICRDAGRDAHIDDPFEHATENFSLAETLVAGTRKCQMIRDSILVPSLQNQR
jgi:hypothetical protein